jgi:hypothetical protein
MNPTVTANIPATWEEVLGRLGFVADAGSYRCQGTLFKIDGQWTTLELPCDHPPGSALHREMSPPALWKWIEDGADPRRVFELPLAILACEHHDEFVAAEKTPALEACLAWALETAQMKVVEEWQPPSRQLIESWIPQGKLTVQSGTFVRQGELIIDPARFLVRFPILQSLPPDLPEARMRWLEELLRDAQNRWRMVRFGIDRNADAVTVVTELDLTGAPHHLIEHLLLTGLDGLRWAVLALVETAELLAETTIKCQALEISPLTQPTQPKEPT